VIKKNKKKPKVITIIPARLNSLRLKRKLLRNIKKVPMIVRVAENARRKNLSQVLVATDSKQIQKICRVYGIKSVLTSKKHKSGTDRIYEAYKMIGKDFDLIVNLQGDLPIFNKELVEKTINLFKDSKTQIASAICELGENELLDTNIVKAQVDLNSQNEGFAINFIRGQNGEKNLFHHIGIYVYKPEILEKFINLKQTKNELERKLEQMRAMDNSLRIKLVKVDSNPPSVDTINDLRKIRLLFQSNVS